MAHHISAKKRIRQRDNRKLHNRYFHVSTRNAVKKFRSLENKEEAQSMYPKIASMLDKLAKKNIIHKNKAANLKSKLQKHIAKL